MSAQMIILFNTQFTGNLNDNECILTVSPKNETTVKDLLMKLDKIQELEKEIHDLRGKLTAVQLREQLAKREKEKSAPWVSTGVRCSTCFNIISSNGTFQSCRCGEKRIGT